MPFRMGPWELLIILVPILTMAVIFVKRRLKSVATPEPPKEISSEDKPTPPRPT